MPGINLILENSKFVRGYTYLRQAFIEIPEFTGLSYVISGYEITGWTDAPVDRSSPLFISGSDLLARLSCHPHEPQFIWAVLSGFLPGQVPEITCLPNPDGNPRYWQSPLDPEIPGATLEIVAWDSSCTLFIGLSMAVAQKLSKLYPDIRNLDLMNTERA